jgi:hypothetical protein
VNGVPDALTSLSAKILLAEGLSGRGAVFDAARESWAASEILRSSIEQKRICFID